MKEEERIPFKINKGQKKGKNQEYEAGINRTNREIKTKIGKNKKSL